MLNNDIFDIFFNDLFSIFKNNAYLCNIKFKIKLRSLPENGSTSLSVIFLIKKYVFICK